MKFNRYINKRPQDLDPIDHLNIYKDPGRPDLITPGGYIYDLAALKKAILLCWKCSRKFNYQSVGYEKVEPVIPGYNYVISTCDGCKKHDQCSLHRIIED